MVKILDGFSSLHVEPLDFPIYSHTKDLPGVMREADILIAALGRAEMVKDDWIKLGAVVIDVGINAKDDPPVRRAIGWSAMWTTPKR